MNIEVHETLDGNTAYDAVNPPHYQRGPRIAAWTTGGPRVLQCIEVMRCIQDPRLATALRYMWRVAFGGKADPKHKVSQLQQDREDIEKAIWYLTDYIEHQPRT